MVQTGGTLLHFQYHWLNRRNLCFHTDWPRVDLEVTFQGGVDMLVKNMAVFTRIELPKTPPVRMERISPLFLFLQSEWLAGVCPGLFLQSLTLQNNYVDLRGAATVPVSKNMMSCKCPNCHFFGVANNPSMSPGCSTLKAACWSSRQGNVFVSFRGIFSTFFLILLLFSLHLRPPRGCISTISLSFYWTAPWISYSRTFSQIQRPRRLLHIMSASFR